MCRKAQVSELKARGKDMSVLLELCLLQAYKSPRKRLPALSNLSFFDYRDLVVPCL